MIAAHTRLLVRDELLGFATSKVMLVLWVFLPALTALGFFLLPDNVRASTGEIPMTIFLGTLVSTLTGTIAAVMIAVDLVNERLRKVYMLFVIRPVRPEAILWAKFFAVFFCVTVACCCSISLGLVIDLVRGVELPADMFTQTARSLGAAAGVIAVSAAVGVFFGVLSNSVLVAVILIIYVGQNLALIPIIPEWLGLAPGYLWIGHALTVAVTVGVMLGAGAIFRRQEY